MKISYCFSRDSSKKDLQIQCHHSKTMSNAISSKKLRNSLRQTPNLERLSWNSKFISVEKHFQVTSDGKNCAWCTHLLTVSPYLIKRLNNMFLTLFLCCID